MPFDPWSGAYYSDKPTPDYSKFGQQQQATDQAMSGGGSTGPGTIGDGTVPAVTRPPGVASPNPGNGPAPLPGQGNSIPTYPEQGTTIGDGTVPAVTQRPPGTVDPYGGYNPRDPYGDLYRNVPPNNSNNPYIQTAPTATGGAAGTAPGQPAQAATQPYTGTGISATDPTKPPNNDPEAQWFWSGTAGHWVSGSYKYDGTGRPLNADEKSAWTNFDRKRASGTLTPADLQMMQLSNTTLPNGTNPAGSPPPAVPAPATPAVAAATAQPQGNYDPLDPAWDYNGVQNVPWQAFVKNLYGENNANMQSFAEVKGVLDEARMKEAEKYGWQAAVPGAADANEVYRAAIRLAQQNPGNDYTIVRLNVNGQPMYAALMREQDPAAQAARGYISPAMATKLAQERELVAQAQATGGGRGAATRSAATRSVKGVGPGKGGGPGGTETTNVYPGKGNFIPPNVGGNPVWDSQTQAAIDDVIAASVEASKNNKPLTPEQLAAISTWTKLHPYSGPYSAKNMPPALGSPPQIGVGGGSKSILQQTTANTKLTPPPKSSTEKAGQGVVGVAAALAKLLASLPAPQAAALNDAIGTVNKTTKGAAAATKYKRQTDSMV